ncbi:MAG: hypothetical protein JWS10_1492 [Cypionkella sp.]|nr:hypothetical protein [Cypionkella sp.]MDB5658877.1 hypothetical protein [Cypionkella sp.]MDB5665742.1 hypothetical protein [Cypionkella sp.]
MSYADEERDRAAPANNFGDRAQSKFDPPRQTYGDAHGFGSGMLVVIVFIVVAIMAGVILDVG